MAAKTLYLSHGYESEIGAMAVKLLLIHQMESFGYKIINSDELIDPKLVSSLKNIPYSERTHPLYLEFEARAAALRRKAIEDEGTKGVISILDGVPTSNNVIIEVEIAYRAGKKILGYKGDFAGFFVL